MKKRIIAFLLMTIMLMSSMTNVMAVSFSDLDSGHWAYEYITTLAEQGVINGYTDGTFRPSGTITAAEFIKLITVAAVGEEEVNKTSVPADYFLAHKWYGKYVYWAGENSLLMKSFGEEGWDAPISRLDMAKILYSFSSYKGLFDILNSGGKNNSENANEDEIKGSEVTEEDIKIIAEILNEMGYKDVKTEEDINEVLVDFSDKKLKTFQEKLQDRYEEIYKEDMQEQNKEGIGNNSGEPNFKDLSTLEIYEAGFINLVAKIGLINGYENGNFKPYNNMTRAEVSTVIYRFLNLIK